MTVAQWKKFRDFVWDKFVLYESDDWRTSYFGDFAALIWSPYRLPQKLLRRTYIVGVPVFLPLQVIMTLLTYVIGAASSVLIFLSAVVLLAGTCGIAILIALWLENDKIDVKRRFTEITDAILE